VKPVARKDAPKVSGGILPGGPGDIAGGGPGPTVPEYPQFPMGPGRDIFDPDEPINAANLERK
jgi:hypothetical protein